MEANQLILKCKKENVALLLPHELFIVFSLVEIYFETGFSCGRLTATQLFMADSGHCLALMETSRITSYLGVLCVLLIIHFKVIKATGLLGRHVRN